nr:type IA DNA topoisomerase [Lachnospiraceae bacterium]
MGKKLFIAEKPSVAKEFARVLKVNGKNADGYIESDDAVVTWCVGHLVTMSYPEEYDPALKKWSLQALPFLPAKYKYQVIDSVKKQFDIVSGLLNRNDIDTIYVCTDSGREGEYIYRLVDDMAGVSKEKAKKRVWIDSQTEEEILKGINTAKDLSEYDHLAASAYLRAKEDYLMGINFSRLLSLKFGPVVSKELGKQYVVLSIGRVMTCVLGMVVRREREIRDFVKTVFYRILGQFVIGDEKTVTCDWKVNEKSLFYAHPGLYKDNGFLKEEDADKLISFLLGAKCGRISGIEKKKEKKNAPLLYNLAEIQNDCSRRFKISPDQTLAVIQELYEKKLVTYPRTDARVLSTAVAKEIEGNLRGLTAYGPLSENAKEVMEMGSYRGIANSKYTNDKQITDHYAIIPTGQGFGALSSLSDRSRAVYDLIVKRFLAIFYPPAEYKKISLSVEVSPDESHTELFTASF